MTNAVLEKQGTPPTEPPSRILHEGNFRRLPVFPLQWRRSDKFKTKNGLLIRLERLEERDGQPTSISWEVRGPLEPGDKYVFFAIEAYITERYLSKGEQVPQWIHIPTFRELRRLMGRRHDSHGKWQLQRLKDRLYRIRDISCTSRSAWRVRRSDDGSMPRGDFVEGRFGLWSSVWLKGEELRDGSVVVSGVVIALGPEYQESLNNNHVIPLDYELFLRLDNATAARLVEVLSGKFYGMYQGGGRTLWQDYEQLCDVLPLQARPTLSQARQSLAKPIQALIEHNFLAAEPEWRWDRDDKRIAFSPGQRAIDFMGRQGSLPFPEQPKASPAPSAATTSNELAEALIERGFEPADKATRLVQQDPDLVRRQIAYFDHELANGKRLRESPGAYLHYRISHDLSRPDGYVSPEERAETHRREEAARLEKQRREADERDRQENWWKYQTPEAKARGYVEGYWMFKWKGEHGFDAEPSDEQREAAFEEHRARFQRESDEGRAAYRRETGQEPPEPTESPELAGAASAGSEPSTAQEATS